MDVHENARTTRHSRMLMVQRLASGWSVAAVAAAHGLRHIRTRPYTPKTNGKAERFIQTSLREWAYAAPFDTSAKRTAAMPIWFCNYSSLRPHSALGGKPPISRLNRDNVLASDS